jgi:3',5'-nucleoside bisphosphate phosphatase
LLLIRADLHVHTVLSPCSDVEMIPPLIVQEALDKGINLLAITDHNATANIAAVQRAARGTDLLILPGMELQTVEEVHVLCLFDTLEQVYAWQKIVDQSMPDLPNNIEFFGEQFVVDDTGDFLGREDRLLLTSTSLTIQDAWQHVNRLGGLLIPAHVNRKAYGLIPVLGFVPTDIPIEILEISPNIRPEQATTLFPQTIGYPLVQNGDAHFLEDIKGVNEFSFEEPTVAEIRLAVLKENDRSHRILHIP